MTSFDDRIADRFVPTVDEQFDRDTLDPTRWIANYLPQWSGRRRSQASYTIEDGRLRLFIADDQPRWLPDVEGDLRVSSIQTGCFAGPLGSRIGQHRTSKDLVVVEEQPETRLITPSHGAVQLRARWTPHPDYMVAMFLIGFEDEPHHSGEICVVEIFGAEAGHDSALNGIGVKRWHDPDLHDDFGKVEIPVDLRTWNNYGAVWTDTDVTIHVNGSEVRRIEQAIPYPMQLLINIYDFGGPRGREPAEPYEIDHVMIYQPEELSHRDP